MNAWRRYLFQLANGKKNKQNWALSQGIKAENKGVSLMKLYWKPGNRCITKSLNHRGSGR